MKYTLLIGCLLLTGCSEANHLLGLDSSHTDYSNTLFVGAGQSNMVYQDLSQTFLKSVNVGEGGTAIAEWQKGSKYYERMLKAIRSFEGPVVLLWWQGETEGFGMASAETWTIQYLKMIEDLRKDTGRGMHGLPVIYVQIGHFYDAQGQCTDEAHCPSWQSISDQQTSLNGRSNMHMVSIKDLYPPKFYPDPTQKEGVHYFTKYKQIQLRLMQAVQEL